MGYGSVAVVVDPPTMTAEHPSASSPEARAFDDVDVFHMALGEFLVSFQFIEQLYRPDRLASERFCAAHSAASQLSQRHQSAVDRLGHRSLPLHRRAPPAPERRTDGRANRFHERPKPRASKDQEHPRPRGVHRDEGGPLRPRTHDPRISRKRRYRRRPTCHRDHPRGDRLRHCDRLSAASKP